MLHSEGHVLAMSWLLDLSERKWILNYVRPCFIFRQMGAQWHTLCSHHIKSPTFLDFHDKQTAFHKRDESALSNSNFAKHVLKLFKRWAPLTLHMYTFPRVLTLFYSNKGQSSLDLTALYVFMPTVETCYSVTYISVALWSCFSIDILVLLYFLGFFLHGRVLLPIYDGTTLSLNPDPSVLLYIIT